MPRRLRITPGGLVYHVLNRGNARDESPKGSVMRYKLANDAMRYWTGVSHDGTQYLLGPSLPRILVYAFGPDGKLIERSAVGLQDPPRTSESGIYVTDSKFIASMEGAIEDIMRQRDVTPRTISIEGFYDDQENVGIKPLPDEFVEFLENPASHSDEDRAEMADAIEKWNEAQRFVFVWGDEHWMSRDGTKLT